MFNKIITTILALSAIAILSSSSAFAASKYALGGRAGFSSSPDQFILGLQGSFGNVGGAAGTAVFAPSADVGVGDNFTSLLINGDLRWYMFRLPETGIKFYGAAGPTLGYYSVNNAGSSTELGLSLTAGARIPMKGKRSYNLEMRFGFGDIPDLKLMLGVMF
jgi:hypothetical protein